MLIAVVIDAGFSPPSFDSFVPLLLFPPASSSSSSCESSNVHRPACAGTRHATTSRFIHAPLPASDRGGSRLLGSRSLIGPGSRPDGSFRNVLDDYRGSFADKWLLNCAPIAGCLLGGSTGGMIECFWGFRRISGLENRVRYYLNKTSRCPTAFYKLIFFE